VTSMMSVGHNATRLACESSVGTMTVTQTPLRLDNLPYDVLVSIASYLSTCASVSSLSQVCSALSQPAQSELFRYLPTLNPREALSAFLALQRKPELARVVKRVHLHVCEADELADSFGLLPAAWLRLVWRTIRKMSSLQQLEISAEERKSMPESLPQLWNLRNLERSNLRLKSCKLRLPGPHPIRFLRQQTALEELSLHMLRGVERELHTDASAALAVLGEDEEVLPKLKALQAPVWASERLLGERRVERLHVKDFLIHPDEVKLLSRSASEQLKVLNLAYLALRPQVLLWIGENLPALEDLRITVLLHGAQCIMDTLTSPPVLTAFSKLPHLRSLHVVLINCHLHQRQTNYAHQVKQLGDRCQSLSEVELSLGMGATTTWKRSMSGTWKTEATLRQELARWEGCWPQPAF